MVNLLDLFIRIFCYVAILVGLWLIVGNGIVTFLSYRKAIRFRTINASKNDDKLIMHLDKLLSVTLSNKTSNSVTNFIYLSLGIFFIVLVVLTNATSFSLFNVIVALMAGILPYIHLRLKLYKDQVVGSYEGEGFVAELINQYKINHCNMIIAIDKCIPHLNKYPYFKKALFRLSLAIKSYRSISELEKAISNFVYSSNTEWAALLGINMFLAISEGTDVTYSLESILDELKNLKQVIEIEKRYNNEAFVLIKYVIPATYVLSVIASVSFFGFTLEKFLTYQFFTGLGLRFGIITIVLMIFNAFVMTSLKKPKYDL